MSETAKRMEGRTSEDGALILSPTDGKHLRAAMRQMDLLLRTPNEDVGLEHLVSLLEHLRSLRHIVS